MDLRLHACAYSLHTKPYKTNVNTPPFFLFRLQVLGRCMALVDGEMRNIEPGDLILVQPGDPYKLHVEENQGLVESGDYYLLCEGQWVEEWWKRRPRTGCQRINLNEGMISLWQQLTIEQHKLQRSSTELIQHLLCALCLLIDLSSDQVLSSGGVRTRSNLVVSSMKRYIEENALGSIRIEDVASMAGLSVSRAVHLFKEVLGYTMIQYTQEIRLSYALERIRYTDWTLEHISQSCGFGTYSHFHKQFKEKFGLSPRLVRDQPVNSGLWDNLKSKVNLEQPITGVTADARRYFNSTN